MVASRWPWLASSALLLASAVAAGVSTYLFWSPCRGAMLNGSLLHRYRYDADFSDGCLRTMDASTPFPFPSGPDDVMPLAAAWGFAAAAGAGLAWLLLVLTLTWAGHAKAWAALPGLATLVVTAISVAGYADPGLVPDDARLTLLLGTPDLAALVAFVMLAFRATELGPRGAIRLLVMLWGTTTFGLVHTVGGYLLMVATSDANWDAPPGTGYPVSVVMVCAAVVTAAITLRTDRSNPADGRPGTSRPAAGRPHAPARRGG